MQDLLEEEGEGRRRDAHQTLTKHHKTHRTQNAQRTNGERNHYEHYD
jgi:hypothetical protein